MKVKLIAVSQPVDPKFRHAEDLIVYCARVSNPSNQDKFETGAGLLRFCVRNQHWSIFEMVSVCMEIECPRTIARQILRHRSFSFQEFSQRYAEVKDMEFELSEARLQDNKNRQNSFETDDRLLQDDWDAYQTYIIRQSKKAYTWALQKGIAKEVARNILPEGLTPSRMYMNGTLRSWIHYCLLRKEKGTQKEHRAVAAECWSILCNEFPFLKELDNGESKSAVESNNN